MVETATKLPVKKAEKSAAPAETVWSPFESLHREIDRLFDDFHPGAWHFPFTRRPPGAGLAMPQLKNWQIVPPMDLVEKDGAYEISVELPGMDEKDVEIKLSNGTLTIKGEKSEEKEEQNKEYHLSERSYGSFSRSFRVPEGVDSNKIDAKFARGLLRVKLPKTAEARTAEKKIQVKAE
jgi:HSP20 family protein